MTEHEPREQTWDEHGKDWHDRGPVWTNARRLYLKYPLRGRHRTSFRCETPKGGPMCRRAEG